MSPQVQLNEAVERFRRWADSAFPGQRFGEWECEYQGWGDLYESVSAVLRTGVEGWNDETKQLLIYVIARDNEDEVISDELTEEQLLVLGSAPISSNEKDAKWQLAKQLGKHPLTDQREKLLLDLASDADEYVRRRSLTALADSGSAHAERLALKSWESGEEDQQMVCLHALWRINSPLLPHYLELAAKGSLLILAAMADRIRNRSGEFAENKGSDSYASVLVQQRQLLSYFERKMEKRAEGLHPLPPEEPEK